MQFLKLICFLIATIAVMLGIASAYLYVLSKYINLGNDCCAARVKTYDNEEVKGFYDGPLMTPEHIKSA